MLLCLVTFTNLHLILMQIVFTHKHMRRAGRESDQRDEDVSEQLDIYGEVSVQARV